MIHVLTIGTRVREPLQTLLALEGLLYKMRQLVITFIQHLYYYKYFIPSLRYEVFYVQLNDVYV